jgi:hypothetical protein
MAKLEITQKFWFYAFIISFLLLILSNLYWLHSMLDQASINKYTDLTLHQKSETVKQLLKIAPLLSKGESKEQVIKILKECDPDSEPFEKEGQIHQSYLSFEFDKENKLKNIKENFRVE